MTIKNDKSKRVKFINEVVVNNGKGNEGKSQKNLSKDNQMPQLNPE